MILLTDNIVDVFKKFNQYTDDYLGAMYINLYHSLPRAYRVYYNENDELEYKDASENFHTVRRNVKTKIDSRKFLHNIDNAIKELNNKDQEYFDSNKNIPLYNAKVFCYSPNEYLVLGCDNTEFHSHNFLMNITLSDDSEMSNIYEEIFCDPNNIEAVFNGIKGYFEKSTKEETITFGIASVDSNGSLYTTWYDYETYHIDIDKNYNDDFKIPYERMCSLIEEDNNGALMFLYGVPGSGKTSVIKNLICKYPEKDFVFFDSNLLIGVPQDKVIGYFLNSQNSIFIFEDCERVLQSRNKGANPMISTLLNLTDGIISDVLGIKIICTFNTNITNVDEALLRKGRLKLKYEFKKLCKEKASAILGEEVKEDMSLADIYNYKEENDFSKQITTKIGF